LLDNLGNKELFLILDNFEHYLTGTSFVNQILNEAQSIKILATSRTSLNVSGEHLFDAWGMPYPESPSSAKIEIDPSSAGMYYPITESNLGRHWTRPNSRLSRVCMGRR
jgi:hypothetical protein